MKIIFDDTCNNKIEMELLGNMDKNVKWTVLDWTLQKPIGFEQSLNLRLLGKVVEECHWRDELGKVRL